MPEPSSRKPSLQHDDYCRIFGRVIFDAFFRIDSLEKQIGPIHESFQAQTETLRAELAETRDELDKLRKLKIDGD
jgi:hypothetical protein